MTICGLCGKPVSEGKLEPTEIVLCKTCGDMLKGNFVFVVRCKDCKHGEYKELDNRECVDKIVYCDDYGIHEPDWFCADGERKEGR